MDDLLSELLTQFSLSKVNWILANDPNPLTPMSLRQMKKLWTKSSTIERYSISQLYLHFLTNTTETSVAFLIPLANESILASEFFKGTEISDELEFHVFTLFKKIKETQVLGYNEFFSVNQVTEKFKSESVQSKLVELSSRIEEGDHHAMQDLSNVMCSFCSSRTLFYTVENEFNEILESFKAVKSLQIFVQILNFLNTFLVDSIYSVDNALYYPSYLKYYKVHRKVFRTLWRIFNVVLEADTVVSQNLIKILPKFWNVFKEKRMKMLPDVLRLLKAIQREKYVDSLNMAEKFVYEVFTDHGIDSALKSYLKSELGELFTGTGFSYCAKPSFGLEALKINSGFPLIVSIEAGSKFRVNTKVGPGCILYCAFVLESQNITFSIKSESRVYCSEAQIEASTPVVRKIVTKEEEVLTIEWDNSYSWMNHKTLRYRVLVLHPVTPSLADKNPAYAILEQDNLVLFTPDKRIEHFSPPDPNRTISEFLWKNNKNSLNLVAFNEIDASELRLPELCYSVDIELAAKYAFSQLRAEKIILVSNSPHFRTCLVLSGKVIRGCKGASGCFKNYSEFDLFVESVISRFQGTLIFFNVSESEFWTGVLASKGVVVTELDIDIERLVVEMRGLV